MLNVSARAAEDEAEQKLRRAGADAVFAPYSFTGARLAQAILRPHVTQFLDFTSQNIGIEQVRVAETCEFVAKSLKDLKHLRKELGVSVLAIRKAGGQMVFNPPADQAIDGGDFLIVMGDPDGLRKLERLLAEVRV
jgi:voltage-gated potassium channel